MKLSLFFPERENLSEPNGIRLVMLTVFLSILNQMEFQLVQNRKENCQHDHVPFNFKGNG